MSIIDKFSRKMGFSDAEDELLEQEQELPKAQPAPMREVPFAQAGHAVGMEGMAGSNVVNFHTAASAREGTTYNSKMKVIVIEPKSFDDAQQVANCLREKRPVVINFDNTEAGDAKRIIDFISGTTYALNGEIKKVGRNVFLCAPSNVNVSYTEEEKKVSAEMPWLKK